MSKEVEKLRQQVEELKSELAAAQRQAEGLKSELVASLRREELLQGKKGEGLKVKMRRSWLWKMAADPNSKMGKVVRTPRTLYRLTTNPQVAKDWRQKRRKTQMEVKTVPVFVPGELVIDGVVAVERVNVVMRELEPETIKEGAKLAKERGVELRIITTDEAVNPMRYQEMVKKKLVPKVEKVSFYSCSEQKDRARPLRLEVTDGDIFLSKGRGV